VKCERQVRAQGGLALFSVDEALKKPHPRHGTIKREGLLRVIIGEASIADAKTIAAVHVAARQMAMPWLPALHTPDEVHWYFKTMVLPVERVLVAREGVKVVGFVSVNQAWLNHLYIAPDHWGVGVGTKLLDTVRADTDYFQLWVFQGNTRARQFYSSRGFSEREMTDGHRNEENEPDVRMDWVRPD
jgi:GNAT superfamily N-acetyltransferase